jgi:hypothetical protein
MLKLESALKTLLINNKHWLNLAGFINTELGTVNKLNSGFIELYSSASVMLLICAIKCLIQF